MTDQPLPDPADGYGLVISDITARDRLYAGNLPSPSDVVAAASALPSSSPNVSSGQPRHLIELSPGSVRVGKWWPDGKEKPAGYRPRERIAEWSRKSRAAMVARLCSLDYLPLVTDPSRVPAMVTLTYPGDWLAVAPTGEAAKRQLRAFGKRYRREFEEEWIGVWKMEFQRRGAVHFHVFCAPPRGVGFRNWLSENWTDVLGIADADERVRHLKAGTGVDYATGLRSTDAKRIAVYFSKHGSANFGDKEYQNRPPAEWVDAGSVGRFWGYWGLAPATSAVEVTAADALFVARVLRRWARANSPARRVVVWRTDTSTGQVRARHANRRPRRLGSGSGFVAVNDGSTMGTALARALAQAQQAPGRLLEQ